MEEKIPAISVIIPMYNCEKYIGQCLDSVLSQTFKDYEVIIADDCSTDRSVEIVEKIIEVVKHRGGNKIRLLRLYENSGGAAIPRNQAMKLSRGKYITFVDGDDLIVSNALEILYNAAQQFDADVVHTARYLESTGTDDQINAQTKMTIKSMQWGSFVDKPTLETTDLAQRIERFCRREYFWSSCSKLYRRDFLVENQIEFLNIYSEDLLFIASCVCFAKNYVRIPNILYVYRRNPNSQTRIHNDLNKEVRKCVSQFAGIMSIWNKHFSRLKFFDEHPEYRFMLINFFIQLPLSLDGQLFSRVSPHLLESFLNRNLSLIDEKDQLTAMTYLFNTLATNYGQLLQARQIIAVLQQELQKSKRS